MFNICVKFDQNAFSYSCIFFNYFAKCAIWFIKRHCACKGFFVSFKRNIELLRFNKISFFSWHYCLRVMSFMRKLCKFFTTTTHDWSRLDYLHIKTHSKQRKKRLNFIDNVELFFSSVTMFIFDELLCVTIIATIENREKKKFWLKSYTKNERAMILINDLTIFTKTK